MTNANSYYTAIAKRRIAEDAALRPGAPTLRAPEIPSGSIDESKITRYGTEMACRRGRKGKAGAMGITGRFALISIRQPRDKKPREYTCAF
jgi:hypothetical protein